MTNKEAIEQLEQMTKLTQKLSPNNKFILACQHAIEVIKRFEGAVEIYVETEGSEFECECKICNSNNHERMNMNKYIFYAIPKEQE